MNFQEKLVEQNKYNFEILGDNLQINFRIHELLQINLYKINLTKYIGAHGVVVKELETWDPMAEVRSSVCPRLYSKQIN